MTKSLKGKWSQVWQSGFIAVILSAVTVASFSGVVQAQTAPPKTECPHELNCAFVPARFEQNSPTDPTDYGNYDRTNRPKDMKIKYIVIHDTEGSYQSAIDWFRDARSYVSGHYVIRSADGAVTQMVRNKDVAWHAGNWYMNMHSIGIEHEGYAAQGGQWYTEAMYQKSAMLVRYLAKKYNVPLDREHIVGHEQYHAATPNRTASMHNDPGPYWNWDYYMKLVRGEPVAKPAVARQPQRHTAHNAVTIAPNFETNKPEVTECEEAAGTSTCETLPSQSANFLYVRSAPSHTAPLVKDPGLHPDGSAGTTEVSDGSARAIAGQTFASAGREGEWTAMWFGGQKGWVHDPATARTTKSTHVRLVTPRAGKVTVPLYGRPVPEAAAYPPNVEPLKLEPLQYNLSAGQKYYAYAKGAVNDYYNNWSLNGTQPGDKTLVIGKDAYIPITYNHRQAYVRAADVSFIR